jgi:hypothetical protein
LDLLHLGLLVLLFHPQDLVHLLDLETLLDPGTPVVQVLNLEHLVHPLDQGLPEWNLQVLRFPEHLVTQSHLELLDLPLVLLAHLVNQ